MMNVERVIPKRRWLIGLFLVCISVGFTQTSKVIVLENADNVEGKQLNGENAREFIGSVRFRQENVHISCDRALQMLQSGRVDLTGNVIVVDDSGITMKSPRGVYFRDERRAMALDSVHLSDRNVILTAKFGEYFVDPKRAFFRHQVVVHDSTSTVTADSLTYFRVDKRSIAQGNVTVYNRTDNITITGHRLDHWSEKQFSRVTEGPVLIQIDSNNTGKFDTLVVRSRVMEAYRDTLQLLLAIDSVRIIRTDLAAVCKLAKFYTQSDSIILRGFPIVWYQDTQVTGDSINVYLKRRKLDHVNVMGNAFAISQGDTNFPDRYDQITGELMHLQFADKGLQHIDVETRAISVYHLYEDSLANGLNKTSGDRIIILFDDGKVQSLRVIGGVEGRYLPENIVLGKELDYQIAGFQLYPNRPQLHSTESQAERQQPKK
jgi:lipopolysaccharide export system protein LptA